MFQCQWYSPFPSRDTARLGKSKSPANFSRASNRKRTREGGATSLVGRGFLEFFRDDLQVGKWDGIALRIPQQGQRSLKPFLGRNVVLQLKVMPTQASLGIIAVGIELLRFFEIARRLLMSPKPVETHPVAEQGIRIVRVQFDGSIKPLHGLLSQRLVILLALPASQAERLTDSEGRFGISVVGIPRLLQRGAVAIRQFFRCFTFGPPVTLGAVLPGLRSEIAQRGQQREGHRDP